MDCIVRLLAEAELKVRTSRQRWSDQLLTFTFEPDCCGLVLAWVDSGIAGLYWDDEFFIFCLSRERETWHIHFSEQTSFSDSPLGTAASVLCTLAAGSSWAVLYNWSPASCRKRSQSPWRCPPSHAPWVNSLRGSAPRDWTLGSPGSF